MKVNGKPTRTYEGLGLVTAATEVTAPSKVAGDSAGDPAGRSADGAAPPESSKSDVTAVTAVTNGTTATTPGRAYERRPWVRR
jgi:hypothetical protein